jgi:hypothetical protein
VPDGRIVHGRIPHEDLEITGAAMTAPSCSGDF